MSSERNLVLSFRTSFELRVMLRNAFDWLSVSFDEDIDVTKVVWIVSDRNLLFFPALNDPKTHPQ